MKHVLFAEFPDRGAAQEALQDLSDHGVRESRCHIELHTGAGDEGERPLNQTDMRSGLLLGLVLAAVLGGAMGWLVVGPLALFTVSLWTGVVTGFLLGLALGLLGGVISGAMNPSRQIEAMELHGGVVATVETDGLQEQESVERIFRDHGAIVERRAV